MLILAYISYLCYSLYIMSLYGELQDIGVDDAVHAVRRSMESIVRGEADPHAAVDGLQFEFPGLSATAEALEDSFAETVGDPMTVGLLVSGVRAAFSVLAEHARAKEDEAMLPPLED